MAKAKAKAVKKSPALPPAERSRRAIRARTKLVPAAVKAAGRKGFKATRAELEKYLEITSPTKLAGWLKGQAKEKGVLSSAHPYGKKKK
jgi:hypothetical protein